MKVRIIATCLLIGASNAQAISPIPEESGLSGFVNVGVAGGRVESNTVAKLIGVDLGDDGINDITSAPSDEDIVLPLAAAEISYTFADTGTQLFFGTLLEDFVRFDSSTRAGIRQDIGSAGTASVSLLGTSPITAAKIWEDPYLTNAQGSRKSTERTAKGYRLAWGEIFGSGLEVRYSWRDQEVDDDFIGNQLVVDGVITAAEQTLLEREGEIVNVDLRYAFGLGEGSKLEVGVKYTDYDMDGQAMAWDGYAGDINWIQKVGSWRFVTNLAYGQFEAAEDNPVYDEAGDFERYGASFTAFYADPFGLKGWNANAGVIYFEEDNDIDFHDQSVGLVQLGMLYRF